MLEKLAEEYRAASSWPRSIPTKARTGPALRRAQHPSVKVLFQGQLVDEFNSAIPEKPDSRLPRPYRLAGRPGTNQPARTGCRPGRRRQVDDALAILVQASQANPQDQAIQLDAVDVLMQLGRKDEAKQLTAGRRLRQRRIAPTPARPPRPARWRRRHRPLEAKLAANADDHAARPELAKAYAAQSPLPRGAGSRTGSRPPRPLLRRGAGRKAILALFEALSGEQYDDLVRNSARNFLPR